MQEIVDNCNAVIERSQKIKRIAFCFTNKMPYKEICDENMLSNEETAQIMQFSLLSTYFLIKAKKRQILSLKEQELYD